MAEVVSMIFCSDDPRAPHGFDRMASHAAGRYVCECEAWQHQENNLMMSAYAEPQQSGAINQRETT